MNQGPIRSRPMPLILPSESDVENCFVASKESKMENKQNQPMFSHGLCNRYSQLTARVLHNSYSSWRWLMSRFLLISYVGRRSAWPTCSDTQIHAHLMEHWRGQHCMQGNNSRAAQPIPLQHDYMTIAQFIRWDVNPIVEIWHNTRYIGIVGRQIRTHRCYIVPGDM